MSEVVKDLQAALLSTNTMLSDVSDIEAFSVAVVAVARQSSDNGGSKVLISLLVDIAERISAMQ